MARRDACGQRLQALVSAPSRFGAGRADGPSQLDRIGDHVVAPASFEAGDGNDQRIERIGLPRDNFLQFRDDGGADRDGVDAFVRLGGVRRAPANDDIKYVARQREGTARSIGSWRRRRSVSAPSDTATLIPAIRSAPAANSVLDIVEREDLAGKARETGAYLQSRMKAAFAQLPIVGEVRGVGMLAAIEFVVDREKKRRFGPNLKVGARIAKAARDRGLIARAMPHGDILGFAPALITSRAEVDEIVAIAEKAVRQVMDELAAAR